MVSISVPASSPLILYHPSTRSTQNTNHSNLDASGPQMLTVDPDAFATILNLQLSVYTLVLSAVIFADIEARLLLLS